LPRNPPVGVKVIVDVPLAAAAAVTAVPLIVKLPWLVTVTVIAVADEIA
jgi:hypothetical protein